MKGPLIFLFTSINTIPSTAAYKPRAGPPDYGSFPGFIHLPWGFRKAYIYIRRGLYPRGLFNGSKQYYISGRDFN